VYFASLALTFHIGFPVSSNCSKTTPKKVNLVSSSFGDEVLVFDWLGAEGLPQADNHNPKHNDKDRQSQFVDNLNCEKE
jgi:hypothetical protein